MKINVFFLLSIFTFAACATDKNKVMFIPDSVQGNAQEQDESSQSWEIIKSQNGSVENGIPAWLRNYLDRGIQGIESLDSYNGKYMFVGKNQGDNFNALQQWANGFTAVQDLPRLIVQRVEKRLVASAVLYPDDEYGEYFAYLIKKVSDGEYQEADKEQIFWIKQKKIPGSEEDADYPEAPSGENPERYVFFVLISIDKQVLQEKIQKIMTEIKTNAAPTKQQKTAINNINQTFFERF